MNLGQFLSSYSPLPTGTVQQHLLALQIGDGTRFVSSLAVRSEIETSFITFDKGDAIEASLFTSERAESVVTRKEATYMTARRSSNELRANPGLADRLYVRRAAATHYSKKG